MDHGGKRNGAGRKPGPLPPHREGIQAFARNIVEDPQVQERMLDQARKGTLPVPLFQLFFHYAYGKPKEQQTDDQVFMQSLLAVVLKHVGSADARREIREVIEAHTGADSLRIVA